jgi:hypothetical protein
MIHSAIARCLSVLLLSAAAASAEETETPMSLPEGNTGIAARYPGDAGIADDPSVVFAESFEGLSEPGELSSRWESVWHEEFISFPADVPPGSAGEQSFLTSHVGGESNGADLYTRLLPGYDKLHFRFYTKFDPDCHPIHHYAGIGGHNPSTDGPRGGAGTRPRGDDRLSCGVEPHGSRWAWDYYAYWMGMGGSPPEGKTWGNSFIHDDSLKVKRGEWISAELMIKLNDDMDGHDGEMALWIDGKLVSHIGPGFPKGLWTYDKFFPGRGGREWCQLRLRRRKGRHLSRSGRWIPIRGFPVAERPGSSTQLRLDAGLHHQSTGWSSQQGLLRRHCHCHRVYWTDKRKNRIRKERYRKKRQEQTGTRSTDKQQIAFACTALDCTDLSCTASSRTASSRTVPLPFPLEVHR